MIIKIEESRKFTPTAVDTTPINPPPSPTLENDSTIDPLSLFATQLELDPASLKDSKLISITNQTAQILKPTALSSTESCYLLLAAYEYALGKSSITYEEWKEICEASKIKSKMPFHKIANNAKNYGHINKKSYDTSKEIILDPKGLELIKKAISKYLLKE